MRGRGREGGLGLGSPHLSEQVLFSRKSPQPRQGQLWLLLGSVQVPSGGLCPVLSLCACVSPLKRGLSDVQRGLIKRFAPIQGADAHQGSRSAQELLQESVFGGLPPTFAALGGLGEATVCSWEAFCLLKMPLPFQRGLSGCSQISGRRNCLVIFKQTEICLCAPPSHSVCCCSHSPAAPPVLHPRRKGEKVKRGFPLCEQTLHKLNFSSRKILPSFFPFFKF